MILGTFSMSSSFVLAKNVSPGSSIPYATFDADSNGTISEKEFNTAREHQLAELKKSGRLGQGMSSSPSFNDVDADKDGQISAKELTTMQQLQQANRGKGNRRGAGNGEGNRNMNRNVSLGGSIPYATFDADGNGTISEKEFNTARDQQLADLKKSGRLGQGMSSSPSFNDVDADNDGQISAKELTTMQQQQQVNRGKGNRRGAGNGHGNRNMNRNVSAGGSIPYATFDADSNGTISEKEFNSARAQQLAGLKKSGRLGQGMNSSPSFADVDADKDGQISAKELITMQQQQQENRGGRGQGKGKMNAIASTAITD